MIRLELPWPPSVNHYWKYGKGCVFINRPGRQYRENVCVAVLLTDIREPLTGRLAVQVDLHPPDKRKRDIDNTMKGLLDSLAHAGVYVDDEQIDVLTIRRQQICDGGAAIVEIQELPASISVSDGG